MKTLKDLCAPRDSVFDPSRRDTVLHLSDLAQSKIDGPEFFHENFVTEGMRTLLVEAFRRLDRERIASIIGFLAALGRDASMRTGTATPQAPRRWQGRSTTITSEEEAI